MTHCRAVSCTLHIAAGCKQPDVSDATPATSLITMAGSAGAFEVLSQILASLPRGMKTATAVLLHTGSEIRLATTLALRSQMPVRYAHSGDLLCDGWVYVPPPCTHLVVNPDGHLTVSDAAPVRRFRPSADWLFESAAASFLERHMAVVLSGLLSDGAYQLRAVKRAGGIVLAQSPADAAYPDMPSAAIATGLVDKVLPIEAIARTICEFVDTCNGASPMSCQ